MSSTDLLGRTVGSEISALAWSPDGTPLLAGTAAGQVTIVVV